MVITVVELLDMENVLKSLLNLDMSINLVIDRLTVKKLFSDAVTDEKKANLLLILKALEGKYFIDLGKPVSGSPETFGIYSIKLHGSTLSYFSDKAEAEHREKLDRRRNIGRDILIALLSSIFGAALVILANRLALLIWPQ